HREALRFGVALDGVADVDHGSALEPLEDASEHGRAGHLDQAPGLQRGLADEVHPAGVAVPAVLDDGDVDIDDVALPQHLGLAGDAVADDVVDRGADRRREALVTQVGRDGVLDLDDVVVADPVQLGGADPRLHVRGHDLQHLGGKAAGDAHAFDVLRSLETDLHGPDYPILAGTWASRLYSRSFAEPCPGPKAAHAGRHRRIHTRRNSPCRGAQEPAPGFG